MRFLVVISIGIMAGLCKCLAPADNRFTGQDCKPAPELNLATDTSFVCMPVAIPQDLIEDKINASLKPVLIQDEDFYNINRFTGKEDHTKVIARRMGKISVSWSGENALCSAPLDVSVERQILDQKLMKDGLVLHLNFQARVTFNIAVNIDPDWRLTARAKFSRLEWISEPVTAKGGIRLKKQVEKALDKKMPEVELALNEQIHNKVNLQPVMQRVWQKLQNPIALNKQERMLWLQFNPLSICLAGIRSDPHCLILDTRVTTFLKTLAGKNPVFNIDSTLPPLSRTRYFKPAAILHLVAQLPFQEINDVLARRLSGQNIAAEGRNFTIKKAIISNCGDMLLARVKVAGDVKGDITFCGLPEFRRDSMSLCVNRFDFSTNTESLWVGGADLVAHDMIQSEIQQYLNIGLAGEISRLPGLISSGIENSKVGHFLNLSISKWDLRPQKIYVQEGNLTILISASAELRIELERV